MAKIEVERKTFDKMPEFIEAIFDVFSLVNKKAENQQDKRLKIIALTMYNYVRKMAKDHDINLKNIIDNALKDMSNNGIKDKNVINLIPVFEYISYNNIELYDFSKIDINDVDISKNTDLERFILTHVYYITQKT